MADLLITVYYFIIAILILVTVHELGHYLAAKWTKTRAEIFSVGMGRRLFGWNKLDGFTLGEIDLSAKDYGENTDWRFSLLPIGGYVKIAGMIDESMQEQETSTEPKPYEFRSKKAWQKIFILSAGVIFNLLLAFIFFAASFVGTQDEKFNTLELGFVNPYSKPYQVGFRNDDTIKDINGYTPNNFQEFVNLINRDDVGVDRKVTVQNDGTEREVLIPYDSVLKYIADKKALAFIPAQTYVVFPEPPVEGGGAAKAGIQLMDTVLSVNGIQVRNTDHFKLLIQQSKGEIATLEILRDGKNIDVPVNVNRDGLIGIKIANVYYGDKEYVDVSFAEAISRGWDSTLNMFSLFFQSVKQIFEGSIEAKQAIGGPIMIAQQAKIMGDLGAGAFLVFLASLSISLAILNILPLPVLDGGHILIVIIEKIRGRELSETLKMRIQAAGMVLMLLLFAVILFVDITR